jgi:hypothetical protein
VSTASRPDQGPVSSGDRFAVVSRRIVFVLGVILISTGVAAILRDRVALGVALVVVAGLLVLARSLYTVARGMRSISRRERAEIPAAPVRPAGAPSSAEAVVSDLVGMNSDGLPYRIDAGHTADGIEVEVRWKVEEIRWKALFVRGKVAHMWRMVVRLDPARSVYRFTEYSGKADAHAVHGPGGASVSAGWTWHRGKTVGRLSATFVEGPDGQVTVVGPAGPRTSWEGVAAIRPGDAKAPVFTVLRNHGWRPRLDWFGARLFER